MDMQNQISANTGRYLEETRSLISGLTSAARPAARSPSGDYIQRSSIWLRSGVRLCRTFLRYTTNVALEQIAENYIALAGEELEDMSSVRARGAGLVSSPEVMRSYAAAVERAEALALRQMETARVTNSIDTVFLRQFIPLNAFLHSLALAAAASSPVPALQERLVASIRAREMTLRSLRARLRSSQDAG